MVNRDKFFFFGFGQTAKYFIKELLVSKKKFKFDATNTKKTLQKSFKVKKFKSYKFKDKKYDKKLIDALNQSDYILISIPPQKKKDIVLENFNKILRKSKIKKLIYLSATSVYGNHNGKWVNESAKLKGTTKFGLGRKSVEKSWLNFQKVSKLNINILRVSGIYSKENNVIKKIQIQIFMLKKKNIFQE